MVFPSKTQSAPLRGTWLAQSAAHATRVVGSSFTLGTELTRTNNKQKRYPLICIRKSACFRNFYTRNGEFPSCYLLSQTITKTRTFSQCALDGVDNTPWRISAFASAQTLFWSAHEGLRPRPEAAENCYSLHLSFIKPISNISAFLGSIRKILKIERHSAVRILH